MDKPITLSTIAFAHSLLLFNFGERYFCNPIK